MFTEESDESQVGPDGGQESVNLSEISKGFQEMFKIILQELKGIKGRMSEFFPRPEKPCSSLPRRNCSFVHTQAESKKRGGQKRV